MSKPASDRIPRVLITVSGGVADVICKPAGVDVRIYDYDVEGCDEAKLDRDPDGWPCVIRRFTTSDPVLANQHWPIVSHSLDDLARINARRWKCPSCGRSIEHTYKALAEVGTPICGDCDTDMEMIRP